MSDNYYKALGEIVKLTRENTALREELANEITLRRNHAARIHELSDQTKDLQQRLTAAEQRNAELVELLHNVSESVTGRNGTFARILADWFDKRDAAINPTESGASE